MTNRPSVTRRLMLSLTLAVGAVVALAIVLLAYAGMRRGESALEYDTDKLIANLAEILDRPVWDLDRERVEIIGEVYGRDPRVKRLVIRESGEKELFLIDRGAITDSVQRRQAIVHDGRQIGEVQVALSREFYRQQIWEFVRAATIVGSVALIAAFITTALLLRTFLHVPMARLSATINAYSAGNYSQAPASFQYAEFQHFERVLVDMGEKIKTQFAELKERQQQLQSLSSRLSMLEEHERRKFSQMLHDHIGQNLTFVKMQLGMLNTQSHDLALQEHLAELLKMVEQIIRETRTLTYELSPPLLYEIGLDAALEWLAEHFETRYKLECRFEGENGSETLTLDSRILLFQSCRELLFNVIKHANAKMAIISCKRSAGGVCVTVIDDGVGFDSAAISSTNGGFGLFNVRERIQHAGGEFKVERRTPNGTCVSLFLPRKSASISGNRLSAVGIKEAGGTVNASSTAAFSK